MSGEEHDKETFESFLDGVKPYPKNHRGMKNPCTDFEYEMRVREGQPHPLAPVKKPNPAKNKKSRDMPLGAKENPSPAKKTNQQEVIEIQGTGPWPGIDLETGKSMKSGNVDIDRDLDLHLLTRADAHKKIEEFITRVYKEQLLYVCVITGRGRDDAGALRTEAPKKLKRMPKQVVAICPATGKHGGDGAIIVKIRRKRKKKK